MKIFTFISLWAFAILFAMAAPSVKAQESLSVDFFYDALDPHGSWLEAGDYGYVWQPHDISNDWRPYGDGRWVYTDAGWTWYSNEAYGWAVYHYGRWAHLRQVGWVWVPGTDWGPAWVSWRNSPEYIGWAPLPPEARFSNSIGLGAWVDSYYDIGPNHYSFVDGGSFGSNHLHTVFVNQRQNVTIYQQTTNITNITYRNNVIYNGGPVYDERVRMSRDRIPQYKLDRRRNFEGNPRGRSAEEFQSRVDGDSLSVAVLPLVAGGAGRPAKVSKTVRDVEVARGWSDAGSPEEVAEMRSKMKSKTKVPEGLPEKPKFERPREVGRDPAEKGNDKGKGKSESEIKGKGQAGDKGKNEDNKGKGRMKDPAAPDDDAKPGLPPSPRPSATGKGKGKETQPGNLPPEPRTPRSGKMDRPESPVTDPTDPTRTATPGLPPKPRSEAPGKGPRPVTPPAAGPDGRPSNPLSPDGKEKRPGAKAPGKGVPNSQRDAAPAPPRPSAIRPEKSGIDPEREKGKNKDKDKE